MKEIGGKLHLFLVCKEQGIKVQNTPLTLKHLSNIIQELDFDYFLEPFLAIQTLKCLCQESLGLLEALRMLTARWMQCSNRRMKQY